mgnify:CR=1 FL=1
MELFLSLLIWFAIGLAVYEKITKRKSRGIDEKKIESKNYYLPYRVRKTIMSEHERLLFCNLRIVLGSAYDVYPQMKLDKIFYVESQKRIDIILVG